MQPTRRQWEEADHKMPASPQQQRFYPWRRVDPIFPIGRRGFSAANAGPGFSWALSSRGERSVKSSGRGSFVSGLCREASDVESEVVMVVAICNLGRAAAPSLSEGA
jgi:hypothetical protein